METIQRDLEAFQARVLNVEQLLDQVETQVRDDYGGKSGIHPGHVNATKTHYQELYSKLKLSFLEMNAKEKFMQTLSQDPPAVVTEEMVASLEAENKEAAVALKETKRHIEALSDTLANGVYHVVSVRDQTRQIVNEALQLSAETQAMEAERILEEQKQQLQQIYAATEEQQREVDDLQWELDTAQQELEQLRKEQQSTESLAVEANRMAKQSDPRIQELHSWYQSATATLLQLVGVTQFHMDARDTLLVTYEDVAAAAAATASNKDDGAVEPLTLRVQLDPATFRLQDAQFIGA
ncbi:hypothetical protein SYNPS1DRAFT_23692 [Syncephalis pseudoplumigaleata]|uniref:Kinetochore protein Sos7 coiled-coil domain-containing protein n=1 Tax=Syncephalis pseudoplumigaleata TaxID=1712513 RepID=A0A4P9YWI2_9FUNG|nr:hypothetical protein SYNPS1DRAFT_23692 [Syncephalis pseudoplumigaleata]|eukprot:RKP24215.1 hypothetical protein SYNPS1DRAFT_23692 [Syncephalis pseudoplumigaleata]